MTNQSSQIAQALKEGRYAEAEQQAIVSLRKNPWSAQGWLFLGESLLQQGYGTAADAAFNRASLLDPQGPWLKTVQTKLNEAPPGKTRPDIARLLATKKVSVAAAIMTFNEERSIERCLRSLLGAVDEIIVLDSSSTDRTLQIIAQFPQVKVVTDIRLEDNFAAKRNKGLEYIESDWVLWVDADEWLEAEDVVKVREAAGLFQPLPIPPLLNICLVNHIGGKSMKEFSLPRMFPLRRGLCYYGRVHEQVIIEGKDVFGSEVWRQQVAIRLHHDGYEPEMMKSKGKLSRNLQLLKHMMEEDPANPGWWLYSGREALGSGDQVKALEVLLEAERKAEKEPRFGRTVEIHLLLIKIYMAQQEFEQAEAVCLRSLAIQPDFPDVHYWLAHIRLKKALSLLRQTEQGLGQAKRSFLSYRGRVSADRDIFEWKAEASLAELALLTGKMKQAKSIYESILQKHPGLDNVRKKLEVFFEHE